MIILFNIGGENRSINANTSEAFAISSNHYYHDNGKRSDNNNLKQ